MPLPLQLALAGASLLLLLTRLPRFDDWPTRFFLLAVWLRYAMAAFPSITYPPFAAGLSLNALAVLAVAGLGLAAGGTRDLLLRRLAVVYPLLAIVLVSGALNAMESGTVNVLLKWGYFIVILTYGYRALERHGPGRLFPALATVFALPIASQAASVALGIGKFAESDGSISYVGGYQHEAVFSIILLTFLHVVGFAGAGLRFRYLLFGLGLFGVVLAHYRTSMMAALPFMSAFLFLDFSRRFVGGQRAFIAILLTIIAVLAGAVVMEVLYERFQDIAAALGSGLLFRPPSMFDQSARELLTGRAYIWSQYFEAYRQGSDLQLLFGFGPEAWSGVFRLYAHNTFVSYLYEYGAVGLALLIVFMAYQAGTALAIRDASERLIVLAAHAGFLVLNMATMPMWQIEGNVLYAIIVSHTWHHAAASQRAAVAESRHDSGWAPAGAAVGLRLRRHPGEVS